MKTSIVLEVILILPCLLAYDYDYHDDDPEYTFHYAVESPYTGDMKSQTETRSGDVVRGQYSFMEADGSLRTVSYVADDIHGFRAVVENTPIELPKPVTRPPIPYNPPRRPLKAYKNHEIDEFETHVPRRPLKAYENHEIDEFQTHVPRRPLKTYEDYEMDEFETHVPRGRMKSPPKPNIVSELGKSTVKSEKQNHFPKSDEDWHAIPDMFEDDAGNGEVIVPLYVPRRFI